MLEAGLLHPRLVLKECASLLAQPKLRFGTPDPPPKEKTTAEKHLSLWSDQLLELLFVYGLHSQFQSLIIFRSRVFAYHHKIGLLAD